MHLVLMPGMPYKIKSIVTRKLEGVNHFHYYLCRQLKGGGMEIFMNKAERNLIRRYSKHEQELYLETLSDVSEKVLFENRFKNFNNKFKRFLRCEFASNNSLKQIPHLSALIWNIQEFQRQLNIAPYNFLKELAVINQYLISALDILSSSKYYGKCPSYGEALLNCYLDLYITFTIKSTQKQIDAHLDFLVLSLIHI